MTIRTESEKDINGIREVNERAFGRPSETELVDLLRADSAWIPDLSLVAELDGRIVGHCLFSRTSIVGSPEAHGILIGHPEYYPRFGFRPGDEYGLKSEFEVPREVFMALPLIPGGFSGVNDRILFAPPFRNVE